MGDFRVREILNLEERTKMYKHAINDIEAFEIMLAEGMFDKGHPKIGAEQELCIVNKSYEPANVALEILDRINNRKYTNELALFNLEINLDPHDLKDQCFTDMENELLAEMAHGRKVADDLDVDILMAGILPTLKYRHLSFDNMTPIKRYRTLSQSLSQLRGSKFEIYLQGVDELMLSLDSVLFEACNTSFQLHLQIHPDEFVNKHNWSQMLSGPVLAACVNSPLLFGNELWDETRIALFKQSLDTRSSTKYIRSKTSRVYFGNEWLKDSAAELWRNDIMRFPFLLTSDDLVDSKQVLKDGGTPELRAIRLHNGTTYTWNRLCYGFPKNNPHLRIECRYLPAGPTAKDEIANLAFWIGLMSAEPVNGPEFWKNLDFKCAKENFIKASRTGLSSVFNWFGEDLSAKDLILNRLIPLSANGLSSVGVDRRDIEKYLEIIENRVKNNITGSKWTIDNYRRISNQQGQISALRNIVKSSLDYQKRNVPLHEWELLMDVEPISSMKGVTVEQIMTTKVEVVNENQSIDFVVKMLDWNDIHHLPVEDDSGNLSGMITDGMVRRLMENRKDEDELIDLKEAMVKDLITVKSNDSLQKAIDLMKKHHLKGLPVVFNTKIVGILTETDLSRVKI